MIFGIITAILFILVSAKFFTNKMHGGGIKRFFSAVHNPLGYAFIGTSIVHFILTLPLIRQRPLIIYLLGAVMMLAGIMAAAAYLLRKHGKRFLVLHKVMALVILVCLIPHVVFCLTSFSDYQKKIQAITFSDIDVSLITDGTYIGDYDAEYIYAKVKVTVADGKIKDIELLEHRNEHGAAGEKVIQSILSRQSIDVDAVTGATNSSKVIKKAVENALMEGYNNG